VPLSADTRRFGDLMVGDKTSPSGVAAREGMHTSIVKEEEPDEVDYEWFWGTHREDGQDDDYI
jgi:hypothetical protein